MLIYYQHIDRVSPPGTPFTMRGTIRPWSAHPHVKRSAGRHDRNGVLLRPDRPSQPLGGVFP